MLNTEDALLLLVDVQEKLVKMVNDAGIVNNIFVIAKSCETLNIPIIATEQYPKGLGSTVEEIKTIKNIVYKEKTSFSAINEDAIKNEIEKYNKKQIIICGIETHICVLQTALSMKNLGYDVFFLKNCSASRNKSDNDDGTDYMKQSGIKVINKEIALFMLLKSSKHSEFKQLQSLIK